jgi:hypothetical protein
VADFYEIQQATWNSFMDALDLAGQEGQIADVPVPPLAFEPDGPFSRIKHPGIRIELPVLSPGTIFESAS